MMRLQVGDQMDPINRIVFFDARMSESEIQGFITLVEERKCHVVRLSESSVHATRGETDEDVQYGCVIPHNGEFLTFELEALESVGVTCHATEPEPSDSHVVFRGTDELETLRACLALERKGLVESDGNGRFRVTPYGLTADLTVVDDAGNIVGCVLGEHDEVDNS